MCLFWVQFDRLKYIGEINKMMQRKGNRFGGSSRQNFAPIKVGEELDVTIEAVGEKGDGMAKIKGFVIFVPNTQKGDNVRIKVTRVLKNVGFAEVLGSAQGGENSEETPKENKEDSEEDTEEDMGEDAESEDEEPVEDSEDF
ncbi:MAG: TRAM domain-containing protein [archaeon]